MKKSNKFTYLIITIIASLSIIAAATTTIYFVNKTKKSSETTDYSETTTSPEEETTADKTIDTTVSTEEANKPTEETKAPETTKTSSNTTTLIEETTKTPETNKTNTETTNENETTKAPEKEETIHTHNYIKNVVRAKCTEDGYTINKCNCGDSYVSDITEKLGHTYTTWYVAKEATVNNSGIKESRCDICDGGIISEAIPQKSHESFVDSRITVRRILGKIVYEYKTCHIWERRTWGNLLSITILENDGLHVIYDNKNGETVEFDVLPMPEYESNGNILDDGTYTTSYVGAFT